MSKLNKMVSKNLRIALSLLMAALLLWSGLALAAYPGEAGAQAAGYEREIIGDEEATTITIDNMETPLSGGRVYPEWALVNLILGAAGIILAVIAVIRAARLEKWDCDDAAGRSKDKADKNRILYRPEWFGATVILGIIGILVFFLTEDFRRQMVLVDNCTIINMVIVIIEFACYEYTFERRVRKSRDL